MGDRILFLDMDGVLNRFDRDSGYLITEGDTPWRVDPEKVEMLNDWVHRHVVTLVSSSTWRNYLELEEMCRLTGLHMPAFHSLWRTHRLGMGTGRRHHEIDDWMEAHGLTGGVALDDVQLGQMRFATQVQTDPEIGLLPEHLERALEIFNA